MRLDINTSIPFPEDDSGIRAAQEGAMLGAKLARMRFDFPDQMLARVAVDNDDGTYDCDRPGTSIYMSAVPVDSPLLTVPIAVGATVLIRFYNRDRSKPRIVMVAGGLGPEIIVALVWAQGQGGPNCSPLFQGEVPVWSPGTVTVVERAECQTLGIVIVDTTIYWLYATALNDYVLEAVSITDGSSLWSTTLGNVALLQRLDLCWGYLFYDQPQDVLVVMSPESDRRAWIVSLEGSVQSTTTLVYNLSQCSVNDGWVVKSWHYRNSVDAGNGNGQLDLLVRGLPLLTGSAWSWNPTSAIPSDLTDRAYVVASGRVWNPFSGTGSALEEGRWPIADGKVAVHVAGWQSVADTMSARLIANSPESIRCITQVSVSTYVGRNCWAALAALGLTSGAATIDSYTLAASTELVTDTASYSYWGAALTELPGRAILLDEVFARDLGSTTPPDYVDISGAYTYAAVAADLTLDRTVDFTYHEYIDGLPANGIEERTGKYQHSIGTPLVFGDPVPRASAGAFLRPEREYFLVPHIRLLPVSDCHMERGSDTYLDGQDIVDAPQAPSDARKDAPHQVVIDTDGRVYRCVQRPIPVSLGGPFCLPVFTGDEEITGAIITGYDELGNPTTTTTQGFEKKWDLYQIGEVKQGWATWMECYSPTGELEWEEDISYYFEVVYRGKRTA